MAKQAVLQYIVYQRIQSNAIADISILQKIVIMPAISI